MKRSVMIVASVSFVLFAQIAQAQWTSAKRLTSTGSHSQNPVIAIDSNNALHVAFEDWGRIYYLRSTDGGATWNTMKKLTFTPWMTSSPAIAIDSSNAIYIVLGESTAGNWQISYTKSTDGGKTWSTISRLNSTSGNAQGPAIAIDTGDTIHVAWTDDTSGNNDIYYARSKDGGATWSAAKRLSWTSGDSHQPGISIDSNNMIHVVWYVQTPGNGDVFYRHSADGGKTWSAQKGLTWTSGLSWNPDIAADSNSHLHIVLDDDTAGIAQIFYRRSTDGGTSWIPLKKLTWTPDASWAPAIAVAPGNILHIAWICYMSGSSEIYYKRSPDGGTTWDFAKRLTWTPGWSYYPDLAIDSNSTLHLVWQDNTDGNEEIYYKNGK